MKSLSCFGERVECDLRVGDGGCERGAQSVFQALMECAAASGFDVKQLDISGRPRLFRVDDSLVQQLKLCVRPEVLKC